MHSRTDTHRFWCVSHGCLMYEGRWISDEERLQVRRLHTIMHRHFTVKTMLDDLEK
ncbi:hypothetical protein [Nocardia asiatica]|uniref:hypothetical protein n=1 Tax=Nocardia asiatica TaxID=209252 RepID=UPI002454CF38|nr:hypothetical protein [Nocardia asiatica]